MGAGLFGNKRKKDTRIANDPNGSPSGLPQPDAQSGAPSPRDPITGSPDPQRQNKPTNPPQKGPSRTNMDNPSQPGLPNKANTGPKGGNKPGKPSKDGAASQRGPCPVIQDICGERVYFDEKELKRLRKKFALADVDKAGGLTLTQFSEMPELISHSFRERIANLTEDKMNAEGKNRITFEDFSRLLSVFHHKCPEEAKIKYLFRMYDINGDNFIDLKDLVTMMKQIFFIDEIRDQDGGGGLETLLTNEEFVETMAKDIITKFDDNNDLQIEYSEFVKMITEGDLETRMNITF